MTRRYSASLRLAGSEPEGLRLLESRLGSYVEPLGVPEGFVATEARRDGGRFILSGKTLAGRRASVDTSDPANAFLPRWASRLASALRIAWATNFTQEIQAIIQQHGLPVDPKVNWDRILGRLFLQAGIKIKPGGAGDDDLEELIHEVIFVGLIHRDMLSRFDPDALGEELPLAKKVTIYLLKVFRWLVTERGSMVDHYHDKSHREPASLDDPIAGTEDLTRKDVLSDEDAVSPEDYVLKESDIRSLEEFRERFSSYVHRYRSGDIPDKVMLLFDLIVTSHDGVEINNRWAEATGTSYSNLRKTLKVLKDEMLKFIETNHLPGSRMSQIVQEIRNRTKAPVDMEPEEELESTEGLEPVVKQSAEHEFIPNLIRAIQAAAKVVDQSMIYIRLQASPTKGPRFLEISFYNPTRRHLPRMGTYRVEVGDWTTDSGLPERAIKDQLATFVVPHMRGDALDADQDLLEKVIRRLRKIVWENAVVYFDIPMEEKPSWRNVIKLDIQTLMDTKVVVQDKEHGVEVVARSLGGEQNLTPAEQNDFEPYPDKTAGVVPFDRTPGPKCPDCGKPSESFNGRPLRCDACRDRDSMQEYRERNPEEKQASAFPDESRLPKGHMVAEIAASSWSSGMPVYVYKAVRPRDNRPYFLVKGNGPATQMGTWLTEEQAQPYLALDGKHYSKQAAGGLGDQPTPVQASEDPNDARPDDPEPSPSAKHAGVEAFDPELHDKDADLSITHMSERLQALGITDTAENMHEAVEGFKEARDAHYKKEASMTFEKYAALKRIAAESPEKFKDALDTLIGALQEQVDNLTTMRENLGGGPTHVEGDPAPAKPVPGAPETISAGLQETAATHPEMLEEAFGEFYLGLDKILSMTENFADALDIPLPEGAAPDEETSEVEEESDTDESESE